MQVIDGQSKYEPEGRIADMIRWLMLRATRVSSPDNVQLVFNCAGPRMSVEIKERESIGPELLLFVE